MAYRDLYYYSQGGTILAGRAMYFRYIEDIAEQQAKFPMDYHLLPDEVDMHEATQVNETRYKHIKGHWYLGLSRT